MKPSGPPGSIVAAAMVGILAALFGILSAMAGIAGMYMIPPPGNAPGIPPYAKSMAIVMLLVFAALSVFGIITSIGVHRLKNWARISMLIWGGVMAFLCGIAVLFTAFVPFPESTGGAPLNSGLLHLIVAVIYGVPVLVGVWWLVLLNQPAIKEQFLAVPAGESLTPVPAAPRCPLPLAILAGFSSFSAAFSLLLPLMNFPLSIIIFSHRFRGVPGAVLFYLSAGLFLTGAIGMLRLQRWSHPLMLGQYFFWMASGTISVISPNYERNMQEIYSQMSVPEGPVAQAAFAQTRMFGILSLIPGVLLIWLLLYFHDRFVQAAAAKEALRNS
jgi:hypothetical protein